MSDDDDENGDGSPEPSGGGSKSSVDPPKAMVGPPTPARSPSDSSGRSAGLPDLQMLRYDRSYADPPGLLDQIEREPVTQSEFDESIERALESLEWADIILNSTEASRFLSSPIGDIIMELTLAPRIVQVLATILAIDFLNLLVTEPVRYGVYVSRDLKKSYDAHAGERMSNLQQLGLAASALLSAGGEEGVHLITMPYQQLKKLTGVVEKYEQVRDAPARLRNALSDLKEKMPDMKMKDRFGR